MTQNKMHYVSINVICIFFHYVTIFQQNPLRDRCSRLSMKVWTKRTTRKFFALSSSQWDNGCFTKGLITEEKERCPRFAMRTSDASRILDPSVIWRCYRHRQKTLELGKKYERYLIACTKNVLVDTN